jgi:hypothetical protein
MPLRLFVTMLVIPTVLALGAMAAIVIPSGDELSWPRFIAGCAAFVVVQVGGTCIVGFRNLRRNV